jgi:hypothetical protein
MKVIYREIQRTTALISPKPRRLHSLPRIPNLWHSLQIDHLELQIGEERRSNVNEPTSPRFDSTIVVKFARFPWEIGYLDAETAAYERIQGHQIGPRFLGHLTEEGRVIGCLMERIPDAQHATPEDLSVCQQNFVQTTSAGVKARRYQQAQLPDPWRKSDFDRLRELRAVRGREGLGNGIFPLRQRIAQHLRERWDGSGKGFAVK